MIRSSALGKLQLNPDQIRDILIKNWMTHDALWYAEVAHHFGMADASPMNLRVCRKLGHIECKRLMKQVDVSAPGNMTEFRELWELAERVFVPDFMTFTVDYPGTSFFSLTDVFIKNAFVLGIKSIKIIVKLVIINFLLIIISTKIC